MRIEPIAFRLALVVGVVGGVACWITGANQVWADRAGSWYALAALWPVASLVAFYVLRWILTMRLRPWFPIR